MNLTDVPARPAWNTLGTIDDLISRIADVNCIPGWVAHEPPLMWKQPRSAFSPAHWRYDEIRPALVAAGRLIGTDLAERRNFVLRNPLAGNQFATTRTLVGAYQSILPGEHARSHRHAPHALRVILESQGSYSVVNGRKHPMESGDIVITPGGHWHGHGHDGSAQAFWFDCLDIPLVHLLEPMTAEEHPDGWENKVVDESISPMRFAWQDTLRLLDAQAAPPDNKALDFGTTITLDAPSMPTITIKVHRLDAGWTGRPYRHSASSILVVLKGQGRTEAGNASYEWSFGDVIALPMFERLAHSSREGAVVVELSDEKLMRHCHFYQLQACA